MIDDRYSMIKVTHIMKLIKNYLLKDYYRKKNIKKSMKNKITKEDFADYVIE